MYAGNLSQARTRLEESLEIQLPLGAPGYISTLQHLSQLEMHEGKLEKARAYWDEVNAMSKQYGLTMGVAYLWSLPNVGYIALQEGDAIQTKEMFSLAIQQFQKGNNLIGTVYSIEGLASLYVKQAQPERATRLFAWADAVREKISDRRPPVEQNSVERDLAVIHTSLNDIEFEKLSTAGRALTTEQAIALALEE